MILLIHVPGTHLLWQGLKNEKKIEPKLGRAFIKITCTIQVNHHQIVRVYPETILKQSIYVQIYRLVKQGSNLTVQQFSFTEHNHFLEHKLDEHLYRNQRNNSPQQRLDILYIHAVGIGQQLSKWHLVTGASRRKRIINIHVSN